MKVLRHPTLGNIMPTQAPLSEVFGEESDWDMALYVEGDAWMVKLELDYVSNITNKMETLEKEFLVSKNYLEAKGTGAFISEFERVFDEVAKGQMPFIRIDKIAEIRNSFMELLNPDSDTPLILE